MDDALSLFVNFSGRGSPDLRKMKRRRSETWRTHMTKGKYVVCCEGEELVVTAEWLTLSSFRVYIYFSFTRRHRLRIFTLFVFSTRIILSPSLFLFPLVPPTLPFTGSRPISCTAHSFQTATSPFSHIHAHPHPPIQPYLAFRNQPLSTSLHRLFICDSSYFLRLLAPVSRQWDPFVHRPLPPAVHDTLLSLYVRREESRIYKTPYSSPVLWDPLWKRREIKVSRFFMISCVIEKHMVVKYPQSTLFFPLSRIYANEIPIIYLLKPDKNVSSSPYVNSIYIIFSPPMYRIEFLYSRQILYQIIVNYICFIVIIAVISNIFNVNFIIVSNKFIEKIQDIKKYIYSIRL